MIRRTSVSDTCNWCKNLAGTYEYPDNVPKDVYRRHENCRCQVTYDPKDGSHKVQDFYSKKMEESR